jgi:hypothetical protein
VRQVEPRRFLDGALGLHGALLPGAAPDENRRAMRTAVARKPGKTRHRRPVAHGRRPLVRATEVLKVDTGAQHAAVDDTGCEWPERPAEGARHRLVEQAHPRPDLSELRQRETLEREAERFEVCVPTAPRHGLCTIRVLDHRGPVAGDLGPHRVRDREQ